MNWLLWQSEAGTKKMIGGPGGGGGVQAYICTYVCIRTCTINCCEAFLL